FMPPRVPNNAARNEIPPSLARAGELVVVMTDGNGQTCPQSRDGGAWNDIYCATLPPRERGNHEFDFDNSAQDVGECIEIAGQAGADLSLYSLELYNGVTGTTYETIPLNGIIPDEFNGVGTLSFPPIGGIQNGAQDGIAIVRSGLVIQFLSYEGILTPTEGAANGITSTDIGVEESDSTP